MPINATVIVTGGTSGLGYYCALEIARQYPQYLVLLASRSSNDSALSKINATTGQKNVEYLPLDLSSLANVRSFVKTFEANNYPPIKALLLNAALQFPDELRMTNDGMEATFAISHVGHVLLFNLLFPYLASGAHIVLTSSGTHDPAQKSGLPDAKYVSAEELAHPTPETMKNPGRQRYSTTKLTNVMWTYALNKRLEHIPDKGLTVVVFDPGLMPGTGLAREAGSFLRWIWFSVMPRAIPLLRRLAHPNIHTPAESGASLAWLAMSPDVSGVYYEGRKRIKSSEESYDEKKQEDLWEWTVKNTAISEEERKSFEIVKLR